MAGNSEAKYTIGKLEGESNWLTWKFQMRHLLLDRELWGLVEGTTTLKDGANNAETADFNHRNQNFEKNSLMTKLILRKRYHMMEMA